ncbi:glycoside hydrolase family 88 protein [Bacteroides sp. 519]|uniref:glycoside hydrolase family 88 protein n=1 Tax=Bacteroides sp. 519 TaxID=2302937 RepID=UPI0013D6A7D7|nr:glycoside hydrolase family 88 protein [Bacteroides sp. 519]NDV60231.1 hypothetical protein [Bacteroides sp. 519]
MNIYLSTVLVILFVFIGFDVFIWFYQWQSRIHIGRWNNRLVWQKAIEKKARKWLKKSPTVKLTDKNYWMLYDILRGKYRNKTIQSWQEAGLLLAFGKEESAWYAKQKINAKTGDWKKRPEQVDEALLAYVLKKNNALTAKAEDTIFSFLLHVKESQATIPYRSSIPDIRFIDTIGMVVPFLFQYGEKTLGLQQLEEYDRAKLPGSHIPSHAYDIKHGVPLGIFDWGRGIGWYILGLIESNADGQFNSRIVALAKELLLYEKSNGGFGAMFFNKNSPCESSGTALIGLLMLNAYRISGGLYFRDAAFRAEKQLMRTTRRTGAIDYCQGDTKGIGYYAVTYSIMPFAQGMALKLSKELNNYAH